jgi:CBS-domain-containing membrane protein
VGVIFVHFIPLPIFFDIALAVGIGVFFMFLFDVVHPPAGGIPMMVIFGSASYAYLIIPIIFGCIMILLLAFLVHAFLLPAHYPLG